MQLTLPPPTLPPVAEDFFITDAIDFNLKHNPGQPCFIYADGTNGINTISHLEFGRAAHRAAHALNLNRPDSKRPVVALLALSDTILYQAIVAGLIVAGCVPFPISPRNTPAAIVNLLEKSSCHRMIATQITLDPLIKSIKAYIAGTPLAETLQIEEVPSFQTIYPNLAHELPEHPFERYPPVKRPSKDDICIYIHSSGSTGFPKAIPQTHRAWVHWALFPGMVDFRDHSPRLVLACMPLPAFHTFGLYLQVLNTLYGIVIVALYPPTATSPELVPVTPSPQNILDHSKATRANGMIITPSILQVWSQTPETVEYLRQLDLVAYAGGSLAQKLGNRLVEAGVKLRNAYGGTEFGSPTRIFPPKEDEREWEYVSFQERAKVRWAPQGDGTFECQLLDWEKHAPMISNLEDVKGYATADLFVNHPTKKHLWKVVGRRDDVIVHSTGEKTVPAPIEDVVMSSPLIQGAIMFGRERAQVGILIEPRAGKDIDTNDEAQVTRFRNELWPIIDEANKVAPAFSRIFKEMILVTSKDKPMPRAGKGTVMRKAAVELYAKEINALYDIMESTADATESATPPTSWSFDDVERWLTEQVRDLIPSAVEISPARDLFEQGFDSLSAAFLGRRILVILRAHGTQEVQKAVAQGLSPNLVYSYPTVKDLTSYVISIYACQDASTINSTSRGKNLMQSLIEKYTAGFSFANGIETLPVHTRSSPSVILLTGSTGNLGSEMLAALLKDDRCGKIYAFNRPQTHQLLVERHVKRFEDKGLDTSLLKSEKLVFMSGDIGQPGLGLDRGQYSLLIKSVNVVIHNAWKLDFNLSLSSFESHIQGTRNLIDFIKSGPNASTAQFTFISSIASAQSWDKSRGPYPEEVVMDASSAVGTGYGESKYVAERVLAQSGLQSTSIRVCQISGGLPNGAWATTDWVPILVKSSISLGMLPGADESGLISWLPMDTVAGSVVNVALNDVPSPPALNLIHPRPTQWREVVISIQGAIKQVLGHDLKLTSFDEWISAIEAHASTATSETLDAIPALKLLDFFRSFARKEDGHPTAELGGLATYSTDKMFSVTGVVKPQQIGSEDAERWIKYWRTAKFLS